MWWVTIALGMFIIFLILGHDLFNIWIHCLSKTDSINTFRQTPHALNHTSRNTSLTSKEIQTHKFQANANSPPPRHIWTTTFETSNLRCRWKLSPPTVHSRPPPCKWENVFCKYRRKKKRIFFCCAPFTFSITYTGHPVSQSASILVNQSSQVINLNLPHSPRHLFTRAAAMAAGEPIETAYLPKNRR